MHHILNTLKADVNVLNRPDTNIFELLVLTAYQNKTSIYVQILKAEKGRSFLQECSKSHITHKRRTDC